MIKEGLLSNTMQLLSLEQAKSWISQARKMTPRAAISSLYIALNQILIGQGGVTYQGATPPKESENGCPNLEIENWEPSKHGKNF
jgi:hypothetical protein